MRCLHKGGRLFYLRFTKKFRRIFYNKRAYELAKSKKAVPGMDPVVEAFLKKLKCKDKTGRNLFYHEVKNRADVVAKVAEMGSSSPFIARRQKVVAMKWQETSSKEKEKWNAKAKKENDAMKESIPQDVYQYVWCVY